LEQLDFEKNLSVYFPEGRKFRIKIYEKFAEVEMGETFVHSSIGQELGVILHVQILETLYLPGTRIFDTGIYLGGSGAQKLGLVKKMPDMSLGFAEIEDRPFVVLETGYSDSGNLTRQRIINWMQEAQGQASFP